MNAYYKNKQMIAKVDKRGNVIGKIEKWEAHKKGILHKALTVALIYKDYYIIQHRKHVAFDGVFDITSSSHQLYINDKSQTTLEATYQCLKREWGIQKKDLVGEIVNEGAVYYKAKDKKSEFTEHEVCDILIAKVKKIPTPNYDFAYGLSLVTKEEMLNKKGRIYESLAPWIKVMIDKKKF
ncbi:MAG: hypothetical protein HYV38_03545 [Candidatus Levybacteria bacterium]|nr:hypothetical protein [Candidatus Levybacteria bacterium]MBI2421132.1 hypothetical protein [Candidatus Levybacteria bacterium]